MNPSEPANAPPPGLTAAEKAARDAYMRAEVIEDYPLGICGVHNIDAVRVPGGTSITWKRVQRLTTRPAYRYLIIIAKRELSFEELKQCSAPRKQELWMREASITSYDQASDANRYEFRHDFSQHLCIYIAAIDEKGHRSMWAGIPVKASFFKSLKARFIPAPRIKKTKPNAGTKATPVLVVISNALALASTVGEKPMVKITGVSRNTKPKQSKERKPLAILKAWKKVVASLVTVVAVAGASIFFYTKGPAAYADAKAWVESKNFSDRFAVWLFEDDFASEEVQRPVPKDHQNATIVIANPTQ